MDMQSGMKQDLLRKIIEWRLDECTALRTKDGFEQLPQIVSTITPIRTAFVDLLLTAANIPAIQITSNDAERIFAPLIGPWVFWKNKQWTDNYDLRIERAATLGFIRAWAPEVASYCINSPPGVSDLTTLELLVQKHDLPLSALNESVHGEFLRITTKPNEYHRRLMRFVASLIDEQRLVRESKIAIKREFPDAVEASLVAHNGNLDDAVHVAAFLGYIRESAISRVAPEVRKIWPTY